MFGDLLRRLLGTGTHPAHPGNPDHEQRAREDLKDFSKPYTGPPPAHFPPSPSGFWLDIEPVPPYRARLHAPGEVTKLLSYEEAWKMLCEQHFTRLRRKQGIRF
ncbi:MAG: hypothetical protein WAP03_20330 [Methylorubrum rhodinum]|uniref:hypothetical protein n=1 Tax=Methylorubrum rhodinum TaxID=29428 RepID=UPI003BB000EC